ncbi:hypothetical protein OH492_07955 [Vibrio chagasii]|nr:hypothetical protein [Vibrio chagasii]
MAALNTPNDNHGASLREGMRIFCHRLTAIPPTSSNGSRLSTAQETTEKSRPKDHFTVLNQAIKQTPFISTYFENSIKLRSNGSEKRNGAAFVSTQAWDLFEEKTFPWSAEKASVGIWSQFEKEANTIFTMWFVSNA